MQPTSNWQTAAVALFDKATARLSDDARQLQETVSWLRRATPIATLRREAHWPRPVESDDCKQRA